jgi:hypothetical protein
MATHVIRPPTPSPSRSNLSVRIGGEVYQSTNPCLPIHPDLVLGIARLERYVVPFSSSHSSYLPHNRLSIGDLPNESGRS